MLYMHIIYMQICNNVKFNFIVTSRTRLNLDEVYQQSTGSQEIESLFPLEKDIS